MKISIETIVITIALLVLTSTALAQTGGGYDLTWNTSDGGGGTSTGGGYEVNGTIGQPDASRTTLAGGDYRLKGGFWPGTPCGLDIAADFDGDCDVDQGDYMLFEACASGATIAYGDDCDDRDFDVDGDVDAVDFATFQRCISGEDVTGDPTCTD